MPKRGRNFEKGLKHLNYKLTDENFDVARTRKCAECGSDKEMRWLALHLNVIFEYIAVYDYNILGDEVLEGRGRIKEQYVSQTNKQNAVFNESNFKF